MDTHEGAQAGPSSSRPISSASKQSAKSTTPKSLALAVNKDGEEHRPSTGNANTSQPPGNQGGAEEEDEDEGRMDFKLIQSFADKIQLIPAVDGSGGVTTRPHIVIPKRGEKDFEPLQETVNLQDMLLEKSREALFNALVGVRGGHSNSISHAILTPSRLYPRVLIVHGHLLDQMGITVRSLPTPGSKGKGKASLELLPEEALYLLERGTLQIWLGKDAETIEDVEAGVGEWCGQEYGVKGAVEMSVMEAFGTFIGREGLTWERYQAYAYLKRLGYNVQRSRQFIPEYFLATPASDIDEQDPRFPRFSTWWLNLPKWMAMFVKFLGGKLQGVARSITHLGLGIRLTRDPNRGTLLQGCCGATYSSIFSHLRIIPAGHKQALPPRATPPSSPDIYAPLIHNPYIPFWHIWKPTTTWSKRNWDRGSEEGMKVQRPDYFAGVIQSRTTPLPSIQQLDEIFAMLPDEPKGPIKRNGPQYQRPARPAKPSPRRGEPSVLQSLLQRLGWSPTLTAPQFPNVNVGALRNGERGFIVGVNDSGNNAWIRFGKTGFEEMPTI